jgi:hypothetical protein
MGRLEKKNPHMEWKSGGVPWYGATFAGGIFLRGLEQPRSHPASESAFNRME